MKPWIMVLAGVALAVSPVAAATWYVSTNGNDGNSGATWALAKQTIQAGVAAAVDNDTVIVSNGTYLVTNTVNISADITVISVHGAGLTVADGSYPPAITPCFIVGNSGAVLDGFTITGGHDGTYAGGVQNNGTVQNCIISANAGYRGGGVYNNGLVQNCAIISNTASFHGGGVWNNGILQTCLMVGNTAASYGGGVWNAGIARNCTVSGNTAYSVGGIFNYLGIVRNSIIYYNVSGDYSAQAGSIAPQYSCSPSFSGSGNIADDPQFANPGAGNYRLQAASPCVNAGINQDWMPGALDLDGNPRIMDSRVDMGAYECTTPRVVIGPVIKANGLTFNAVANHANVLSVTVQMTAGPYVSNPVDWWVLAQAGSQWYYLDSTYQGWVQFDGNLANCRPTYEGELCDLPPVTVLSVAGLPAGSYAFYFAVDYPMDGVLNLSGPILYSAVSVSLQ